VKDKGEAFDRVMSMIPEGATVGYGDSLTLRQIGVVDALEEGNFNKTVIIEREFANDRYAPVMTVIIVGEELGL
jgi:hypothetical protein